MRGDESTWCHRHSGSENVPPTDGVGGVSRAVSWTYSAMLDFCRSSHQLMANLRGLSLLKWNRYSLSSNRGLPVPNIPHDTILSNRTRGGSVGTHMRNGPPRGQRAIYFYSFTILPNSIILRFTN